MATLTAAMHPAYEAALAQLLPSEWPEDATERAARAVAAGLWSTRKALGNGWRITLRNLQSDPEARNEYAAQLTKSLRAQGAKQVTPLPIARAIQFAAQTMANVRNVEETGR